MLITKASYPHLFDIIDLVQYDAGKYTGQPIRPIAFDLPASFDADTAETALAQLTPYQRETLAIGDLSERGELIGNCVTLANIDCLLELFSE